MASVPVSSGFPDLPRMVASSSAVPDQGMSIRGLTSDSSMCEPLAISKVMSLENPMLTSLASTTLLPKLERVS